MRHSLHIPLALALGSVAALHGQTAAFQGALANFEIVNDSGSIGHGYEIQLEGATVADLYYTATNARYGAPSVVPYATGINIRYAASYNGSWSKSTPTSTTISFTWQDCYLGGAGYATSGCEIFGQSLRRSVGITPTGYWLIEDPANPGQLIRTDPSSIPFGYYSVFTGPAAVGISVPAPVVKPAPPAQFGEATWMKVFKTSLSRSVGGDELVLANSSVVPDSAAQIETNWVLLQKAPPGVQNRRGKGVHTISAVLTIDDGSHVRRMEVYKFSGTYDALTHEATCADGTCTAPSAGELGAAVSANNTAANAVADSLTVTKSGSGASSATVTIGTLTCGANKCANFNANGANVPLTANAGSTVFGGWTGACSGNAACTATINGKTTVDALFLRVFTLSVGRSNPGTIQASPNGNDRALNCGGACSAKFTDGTAVALTAIPPAGKTFVNWSGGCTGTDPTCVITIAKDTSVTAVFSK